MSLKKFTFSEVEIALYKFPFFSADVPREYNIFSWIDFKWRQNKSTFMLKYSREETCHIYENIIRIYLQYLSINFLIYTRFIISYLVFFR